MGLEMTFSRLKTRTRIPGIRRYQTAAAAGAGGGRKVRAGCVPPPRSSARPRRQGPGRPGSPRSRGSSSAAPAAGRGQPCRAVPGSAGPCPERSRRPGLCHPPSTGGARRLRQGAAGKEKRRPHSSAPGPALPLGRPGGGGSLGEAPSTPAACREKTVPAPLLSSLASVAQIRGRSGRAGGPEAPCPRPVAAARPRPSCNGARASPCAQSRLLPALGRFL